MTTETTHTAEVPDGLWRPALTLLIVLTLLTGLVYPMVVTLAAQSLFPQQANGSLIRDANGKVIGSALIGQSFTEPKYFWSRPSATGGSPYNAAASSGSNLGPLNPALTQAVSERVQALRAADPNQTGPVPVDLVTTSASGLDPHISLAAAQYQLARVARARGLSEAQVQTLLDAHAEHALFGILGEARVHVLNLNLALDAQAGAASAAQSPNP